MVFFNVYRTNTYVDIYLGIFFSYFNFFLYKFSFTCRLPKFQRSKINKKIIDDAVFLTSMKNTVIENSLNIRNTVAETGR